MIALMLETYYLVRIVIFLFLLFKKIFIIERITYVPFSPIDPF